MRLDIPGLGPVEMSEEDFARVSAYAQRLGLDVAQVVGSAVATELAAGRTSGSLRHETFTYTLQTGEKLTYDISLARLAVQLGKVLTTVEVDREQMAYIAENNEWTEEGVAAADLSEPGIAAPITAMLDGEMQGFYVLIDGTHRCVRALREGAPFSAHLLTEEAAQTCFVSKTGGGDD